jgi:flagellar assembly protein FliH
MSEFQAVRLAEARPLAGFRPLLRHAAASAAVAALPAASADDSFALGYQQGLADAEQLFAGEREQFATLVAACEALQPGPSEELALLIAETVERLVRLTAGELAVDTNLLLMRARRAAGLIAEAERAATLRLHPEDLALLDPSVLPLPVVADPNLSRGSLRIEDSTGWVEDGVATHLEALREQLGLEGLAQ